MISEIKGIIHKIIGLVGYRMTKLPDLTRDSTRFVRKYLKGDLVVAEVGTFKGNNALNLLKNLHIKKLYLIDSYDSNYDYGCSLSLAEKEARKKLSKYTQVIFIKKTSDEAVKYLPNDIDFIYIDGNHDYEFVKKDIENYYKKVKRGGVLAGHDINLSGVNKAFIEFIARKKIKWFIEGEDWWIIKK